MRQAAALHSPRDNPWRCWLKNPGSVRGRARESAHPLQQFIQTRRRHMFRRTPDPIVLWLEGDGYPGSTEQANIVVTISDCDDLPCAQTPALRQKTKRVQFVVGTATRVSTSKCRGQSHNS